MIRCDGRKKFPKNNEGVGNEIPPYFLKNCQTLEEVIIPQNVLVIDEWAFSGCENLSLLVLNSDLKFIMNNAFYNCKKLQHVQFHDNIKEIGQEAFMWTNIRYVRLGDDTKYYSNSFGEAIVIGGILEEDYMEINDTPPFEDLEQEYFQEEIMEEPVEDMEVENVSLPKPDINPDIMDGVKKLFTNSVQIIDPDDLPKMCSDVLMLTDEDIADHITEDEGNIVFLTELSQGYKAECFSIDSLKTIIKDDTGNYLFYECVNKDSLANIMSKELYVRLPIFGSTFLPYEFAIGIIKSRNPIYVLKYIEKDVKYSVNYGIYHHVQDFVSGWHCNPGSNFKVQIPVPVNFPPLD